MWKNTEHTVTIWDHMCYKNLTLNLIKPKIFN